MKQGRSAGSLRPCLCSGRPGLEPGSRAALDRNVGSRSNFIPALPNGAAGREAALDAQQSRKLRPGKGTDLTRCPSPAGLQREYLRHPQGLLYGGTYADLNPDGPGTRPNLTAGEFPDPTEVRGEPATAQAQPHGSGI